MASPTAASSPCSALSSIVYFPSAYTNDLITRIVSRRSLSLVHYSLLRREAAADDDDDEDNHDQYPCEVTITPDRPWSEISLQWLDFECIDWPSVMSGASIASSYLTRKGLIRKAQFAYYLKKYSSKRPGSILNQCVPESHTLEIDDPDYFDEALCECPELVELGWRERQNSDSDSQSESEEAEQPNVAAAPDPNADYPAWILKASMVNGGAGIYLIRSLEDVQSAVEAHPEVREWVYQRYIARPLLINQRKFHIRVYALCTGNLAVHFSTDLLALFAADPYQADAGHITNSCANASRPLWDPEQHIRLVEEIVEPERYLYLLQQIALILHDTFQAMHGEPTCFMPYTNCFELLGVDLMVDEDWRVWLLECNASPDFGQTGDRLKKIVKRVMENTAKLVVDPIEQLTREGKEQGNGLSVSKLIRDHNLASSAPVGDLSWGWEELCSSSTSFACLHSPSQHLIRCYQRIVSDTLRQRMKVY